MIMNVAMMHSASRRICLNCATHATGTAEREAAALLLEASAPPGSTVEKS